MKLTKQKVIEIFDMDGKLIFMKEIQSSGEIINIDKSNYARGIKILSLKGDNIIESFRLIF